MSSANLSSLTAFRRREHRSPQDLLPLVEVQCFSKTAQSRENPWSGTHAGDGAVQKVADPLVQYHAARRAGVEGGALQRGVCGAGEDEGTGVRIGTEPRLHVL